VTHTYTVNGSGPFLTQRTSFYVLTVQEVEISREHEDGEKLWDITWTTKSEGGGIGPVKPVHMILVTTRVFFEGY